MHSEFESKKMNIEEIKKKISEKYNNYNHFMTLKSSIDQKYDNQFTLEKVNLDQLPNYIKLNSEK